MKFSELMTNMWEEMQQENQRQREQRKTNTEDVAIKKAFFLDILKENEELRKETVELKRVNMAQSENFKKANAKLAAKLNKLSSFLTDSICPW